MIFTFIKIIIIIQIKSSLSVRSYRDAFKTECGRTNSVNRIIGGRDASKGVFPFFARVGQTTPTPQIYYFCGASVITDLHILTADHCFPYTAEEQAIHKLVVVLGAHYNQNVTDRNVYSVEKLIPFHLDDSLFQDDIALLVLTKKIKFTNSISPICLPDTISTNSLIGENATVIGFGLVDSVKKLDANILQKATVTIKNLMDCEEVFQGPDRAGQLCAGSKNRDSCTGDSGGPLFKLLNINGASRYTQIGIVSYGGSECEDENPAVYTDINYYLNWIDSHLKI